MNVFKTLVISSITFAIGVLSNTFSSLYNSSESKIPTQDLTPESLYKNFLKATRLLKNLSLENESIPVPSIPSSEPSSMLGSAKYYFLAAKLFGFMPTFFLNCGSIVTVLTVVAATVKTSCWLVGYDIKRFFIDRSEITNNTRSLTSLSSTVDDLKVQLLKCDTDVLRLTNKVIEIANVLAESAVNIGLATEELTVVATEQKAIKSDVIKVLTNTATLKDSLSERKLEMSKILEGLSSIKQDTSGTEDLASTRLRVSDSQSDQ